MLLHSLPETAYEQLATYVQLLMRWNARMNLTAVRDPRLLVALHIGESLRCGQIIPAQAASVLDFGSGPGLPGIPIQIARPELRVMLAESQAKKAAFLREAVRELALSRACVHAGRVQALPPGEVFDVVVLRAVDRMGLALPEAAARICSGGACMVLTSEAQKAAVMAAMPALSWQEHRIPDTQGRLILHGSSL